MLASVALPADHHRASAFRRFPPGCGRHHNASAGPPPHHPLPITTAAAKTKPPLPNPSTASGATKTAPPQPKPSIHAAASLGTAAPCRGVVNGRQAAAAVTVRRVSAVRRYPPGCGRAVAVYKPPASVGKVASEAGASKIKPLAVGGNGTDSKARACDREMMLRKSALDHAEFNSNGGMKNGGDGDADAQEEGGRKPWVVTGIMAVPFLPWAQYGRRSQRPKAPSY
ncbi:hypothetical protein BS78_10G041600 [Paspalum vaginatum]|nr:hypothetical protein BS78_10G041600 [Paspalum vaginatum]